METPPKAYDLDLAKFRDEELVVLAKDCGYLPARNHLILRYRDWLKHRVARLAASKPLPSGTLEDAHQYAFFAMLQAIAEYDTLQMASPTACSFRTFLQVVLTARFQDLRKQLWRQERHFDRSAVLDCVARQGIRSPEAEADARERLAKLHAVLDQLSPPLRRLWDRLAAGHRLRDIAAEFSVSYHAAKRLRRKMLAEISGQLSSACTLAAS